MHPVDSHGASNTHQILNENFNRINRFYITFEKESFYITFEKEILRSQDIMFLL